MNKILKIEVNDKEVNDKVPGVDVYLGIWIFPFKNLKSLGRKAEEVNVCCCKQHYGSSTLSSLNSEWVSI